MSEENKQDLKEKETKTDETLNLTGKELEEYKTYLKFKSEIEKQNESQKDVEVKSHNVTQNQSQDNKSSEKSTTKSFQKEMGITDRNDPDYTFDEDFLEKTGYKQYFMERIDVEPIEKHRKKLIRNIKKGVASVCLFYLCSRNYNETSWILFKSMIGLVVLVRTIDIAKQLIVTEPISSLKQKINSYNSLIRDAEWVKLSNDDENFIKYYNIAKYTIISQLYLIEDRPKLRRDKYTEVYHILNSNIYVVYGIYDSTRFKNTRYLGYMLVIEKDKCVLNLIDGDVMREKLTIFDDI